MRIGIDWDDTFTADPVLWGWFIEMAVSRGHRVWIVTWRDEDWPIERVPTGVDRVVYCGLRSKERVIREMGEEVDVWIDDTPFAILNDCPSHLRRPDLFVPLDGDVGTKETLGDDRLDDPTLDQDGEKVG